MPTLLILAFELQCSSQNVHLSKFASLSRSLVLPNLLPETEIQPDGYSICLYLRSTDVYNRSQNRLPRTKTATNKAYVFGILPRGLVQCSKIESMTFLGNGFAFRVERGASRWVSFWQCSIIEVHRPNPKRNACCLLTDSNPSPKSEP